MERIIKASSLPGDLVVDPFAGTGTTAAVANRLGRKYITMDISETYVDVTRRRLASQTKDMYSTGSNDGTVKL